MVGFGTDQAPRRLNKTESGLRKCNFPEWIPSPGPDPFRQSFLHRLCRNRKGDFGDQDMRTKVSFQIESLRKRGQTEKNGSFPGPNPLFVKSKDFLSGSFPLNQDSSLPFGIKSVTDGFHLSARREKDERTFLRRQDCGE